MSVNDSETLSFPTQELLNEVLKLARSCDYEKEHSHQVTKLALRLFDELKTLHGLGERERLLLQSASLLHDIGWIRGRLKHHKTSRDIILKSFQLPLNEEERIIVAMVARYHRQNLPRKSHKYFCDLNSQMQERLRKLAAFLRLADGLDRSHMSYIEDLHCEIGDQKILVILQSSQPRDVEESAGQKKSDLLEAVFERNVFLRWASVKI